MPSSGREYVRLYAALATHPKWGRLPLLLRGAWTSLLVYAATRNDPTFTHEQAVWLLKRDGAKSAARLVDALVDAGWLDRDGEAVALHGWAEHQPVYRGPSDNPEYKRQQERARYQRKAGAPSGTSWDGLGAPVTEERRGEEMRGPPPTGADAPSHEEAAVVLRYQERYGRLPAEPGRIWLRSLEQDAGPDRALAAFDGEHDKDSNPRTLIGRMRDGLEEGSRRRTHDRGPT